LVCGAQFSGLRAVAARPPVLACPVPPFGLLPSTFSLALTRPALFSAIGALAAGRSKSREALAERTRSIRRGVGGVTEELLEESAICPINGCSSWILYKHTLP
jgi:hypothetical protein